LRALKFPEELIAQPPSLIEKKRIICSRHFVDSCFELKDDGILHLIQGSVPELFLEELQINEQQVYCFPFFKTILKLNFKIYIFFKF